MNIFDRLAAWQWEILRAQNNFSILSDEVRSTQELRREGDTEHPRPIRNYTWEYLTSLSVDSTDKTFTNFMNAIEFYKDLPL